MHRLPVIQLCLGSLPNLASAHFILWKIISNLRVFIFILLDLWDAFNIVEHPLTLDILSLLGFWNSVLSWFSFHFLTCSSTLFQWIPSSPLLLSVGGSPGLCPWAFALLTGQSYDLPWLQLSSLSGYFTNLSLCHLLVFLLTREFSLSLWLFS